VERESEKHEVRDCCLCDLFAFDLIEACSEINLPPLERVFTPMGLYHNHDAFYHYVCEEKLSIIPCAFVQNFTAAVNRVGCFGLLVKYRHSFATVIPLNHEISQLPTSLAQNTELSR